MKIEISAAGVTFRKIKDTAFEVGSVCTFQHQPILPKYPKAIAIYNKGLHVGYVPEPYKANGEKNPAGWMGDVTRQDYILNNEIKEGLLLEYKYKDGEEWISEPRGLLHFFKVGLGYTKDEIVNSTASQNPSRRSHRDYTRFGPDVISITDLLEHLKPEGDNKYLDKWMVNNFATHDEYEIYMQKKRDEGTDMHNKIEAIVYSFDPLFHNLDEVWFKNFHAFMTECSEMNNARHNKSIKISTEQQVYDKDLNLAGTYDCKVGDTMIDWKSAKDVSLRYKIQIAFYAKMTGCSRALVVPLGYVGNIMTPVNKHALDQQQIDKYYNVVVNIKGVYDLLKENK